MYENNRMTAYTSIDYPDAPALNPRVRAVFDAQQRANGLMRSHFFHGRFENIYLPLERIPELRPLLEFAARAAGGILGVPGRNLRTGFWFNLMRPGDVTTRHTHDEDDELLSAVYYLSVPPASGDLILYPPSGPVRITPREGQLVLFSPSLAHEVGENRSAETRLSVGMNFGPA
jgi:hypothetical protein